jgi:hypothetical protein
MKIKNFSVDIDNPSDIKKTISILQKLRKNKLRSLGYHQSNFQGSKWNYSDLYPAIELIYNSDISSLYSSITESNNREYYVYVHCDSTKKLSVARDIREYFLATKFNLKYMPFYVGKGTRNRFLDFNRNDSHRKIRTSILKRRKDIEAIKICENLTETEALMIESKIIDILGSKHTSKFGMLINLDEGKLSVERRNLYGKSSKIKHLLKMNGF